MKDIFNENVPLKTETPAFAKHVFPEIHPNIKVKKQKTKQAWQIKQAWLDGFESGKQFEKKKEQ